MVRPSPTCACRCTAVAWPGLTLGASNAVAQVLEVAGIFLLVSLLIAFFQRHLYVTALPPRTALPAASSHVDVRLGMVVGDAYRAVQRAATSCMSARKVFARLVVRCCVA